MNRIIGLMLILALIGCGRNSSNSNKELRETIKLVEKMIEDIDKFPNNTSKDSNMATAKEIAAILEKKLPESWHTLATREILFIYKNKQYKRPVGLAEHMIKFRVGHLIQPKAHKALCEEWKNELNVDGAPPDILKLPVYWYKNISLYRFPRRKGKDRMNPEAEKIVELLEEIVYEYELPEKFKKIIDEIFNVKESKNIPVD